VVQALEQGEVATTIIPSEDFTVSSLQLLWRLLYQCIRSCPQVQDLFCALTLSQLWRDRREQLMEQRWDSIEICLGLLTDPGMTVLVFFFVT
jgi:hypothetical protein